MLLPVETKKQVVNYCNRDIVPDEGFDIDVQFPSEWFENYFLFLNNRQLSKHLGEAFYQARFIYKLMSALSLPLAKNKGIVKFQIIQYASICEAVLDYTIETFFKDEAQVYFSVDEYTKYQNALSSNTKIMCDNEELILCKYKSKKRDLKFTRVDFKAKFAVDKRIITVDLKEKLCELYDLRNNIHILKASNSNYTPRLNEAKNAFQLMMDFVEEIKRYFTLNRNI